MKRKKINLLIICVFIALAIVGCEKVVENPLTIPYYVKKEPNYLTESVEIRTINETKMVYAKVYPIKEESYSFPIEGYVSEIFVTKDDDVSIGDKLIKIEALELENEVRDMEIYYEIEKLKIDKLKKLYETTGNGKYELDIALLDFKITQYQYDKLMEKTNNLTINSKINGVVDLLRASVNKFVSIDELMIKVADKSDTYLSFANPYIPGFIVGSEVSLFLSNTEIVKAIVIDIDEKENLVTIKSEIEDDRLSKIGSMYKVEIVIDQIDDTIAIKDSWVQEAAGREFVYVLENGVMTEREISKGKTLGGWIEVLLGLEEGDKIIINSN